ncbi:MAG: hypothetical protein Q8Q31_04415 [Nanoarchaeota archaeon]|nr:hypothetical protein [Nanoarchaeota archaeon]
MQEKRRSILNEQYRSFVDSWSLKRKFWFSYVFDLIFYFLIIMSFIFWGSLLKKKAESLAGVDYASVFSGNMQQMNSALDILQSFYIYLIISLAILALVMILIFTLCKGVIWTSLMNKGRTYKYFRNLFFSNLLFYIPFLLILVFLLMRNQSIIAGILFLLVLHFNGLSLYFLSAGEGLWKGLKNAFRTGYKVHKFLLFYALFGILFFILDLIFGWIRNNFTTNFSSGLAILLLLVLFLAIVRNGFIKLVDKIK